MQPQVSLPMSEIQDCWDDGIRLVVLGTPQPHPKDHAKIVYPRKGKPFAQMYLRTTPEMDQFKDAIIRAAQTAMAKAGLSMLPKCEPVSISARFEFVRAASNKTLHHTQKPDTSNLFYLPENALKGVCYEDDSQVVELMASKCWSREEQSVITIRRFTNDHLLHGPAATATAELLKW